MVAFIQAATSKFTKKQTFKTSQFNKKRLSICRLKSEQKYSEKEVREGTFYG